MDDDLYDNPTETEIVTQPLHPPLAEWISKQYHHNRSSVEFHKLLLVYLNGGNLKDLIAAARPEPVAMFTAVSIAHGIAKLLAELHSHQLAYGNLTPASVILKPNLTQLGFFYVLLAKGLQSEDVAGMKEDMYSYGQLLSEMLNPQHQDSSKGEFPENLSVPGHIKKLIQLCCSNTQSERPSALPALYVLEIQPGPNWDTFGGLFMNSPPEYKDLIDRYRLIDVQTANAGFYALQCTAWLLRSPIECILLGYLYKRGAGVLGSLNKAAYLFQMMADLDHPLAQYNLASILIDETAKESKDKAIALFQKAADQGSAEAMRDLGMCYILGNGVAKDIQIARSFLECAVERGDTQSLFFLAILLKEHVIEKEPEQRSKVISLFQRAAELGHASSTFELAQIFRFGRLGFEKDWPKAFGLIQASAMQGHPPALLLLGQIFEAGESVEKDTKRALSLYQAAASLGDPDAVLHLAMTIAEGKITPRDLKKVTALYQVAAQKGHPVAQWMLGRLYEEGIEVELNINKAISLYEASADQNFPPAQYRLGNCYWYGIGIPQDRERARGLIQAAADADLPEALDRMAWILYLDSEITKSLQLFQRAADLGHAESQCSLGEIYLKGEVTDQYSKEKGLQLIRQASDQGLPRARTGLGALYLKGEYLEKDNKKAAEMFFFGALKGYDRACKCMGLMYTSGEILPCDSAKATVWLKAAEESSGE